MPVQINNETYYNTKEAQNYLGVSKPTLDGLVERGELRRYRQGIRRTVYYRKAELDRVLEMREETNEDE